MFRGMLLCALTAAVALACSGKQGGRPGGESRTGDAAGAIESSIERLLSDYAGADRPGACVLVRHRGAVLVKDCLGLADLERGVAADPQTNFRLASVTKQLTAMAIIQLVEAGGLSYGTSLTQIFQGFPAYGERITVRHLLSHTSGLIAYESVLPEGQTEQVKDADVLRMMMAQDSTYFVPGSEFRYSNSGYAVLAMAVEKITGERFADVLAERIFEPLNMRRTVAHEEGVSTVFKRAYGYTRSKDGWEFSDQSRTSAVLGDGGVYSSIEDLSRWLEVVEGRVRLVDPASLSRAFEPVKLTSAESTGYGFGWYVADYKGRPSYRHDGSTRGFRNAVVRFPEEDLTVVFLSNRNEVEEGLVGSIVEACLEAAASRANSAGGLR